MSQQSTFGTCHRPAGVESKPTCGLPLGQAPTNASRIVPRVPHSLRSWRDVPVTAIPGEQKQAETIHWVAGTFRSACATPTRPGGSASAVRTPSFTPGSWSPLRPEVATEIDTAYHTKYDRYGPKIVDTGQDTISS